MVNGEKLTYERMVEMFGQEEADRQVKAAKEKGKLLYDDMEEKTDRFRRMREKLEESKNIK